MEKTHRKVRSYVRREGRFTPAQREAFSRYWSVYGIEDGDQVLDYEVLFGRHAPVHLELGFGDGQVLKTLASRHPEHDYLGVEVHRPGVGRLMRELADLEIDNVRIACTDGSEFLQRRIAESSLSGIMIFFPDPWPKKKHHKRRLIQPAFVAMAASRLQPGGSLHLATDWEDYALQMLEVLSAEPSLQNTASGTGFSARPESRPLSKYEARGQRLGHGVWDLIFRRRQR